MNIVSTSPDGTRNEFTDQGSNFTLGLAAQLFKCRCGQTKFVDGGDIWDCSCGMQYVFEDDEQEQTGYLHQD